jgi:hypothetical protein
MSKRLFAISAIWLLTLIPAFAQQSSFIRIDRLLNSGAPDPAIDVTSSTQPSISTLQSFLQNLPSAPTPDWPYLALHGYQLQNHQVADFPKEVIVFQGTIQIYVNGSYEYFQDSHGLESYLNRLFGVTGTAAAPRSEAVVPAVPPLPTSGSEPMYDPAAWNDADGIQFGNNCYNYGCNKMTGTRAQPGKASGMESPRPYSCKTVFAAAIRDGLLPWIANVQCPAGCYKIALVVRPASDPDGDDFHWYRQDSGGNWSHKRGGTAAKNVDESGKPIVDPRAADRDGYTNFCGFMCVNANPADVNISLLHRCPPRAAASE